MAVAIVAGARTVRSEQARAARFARAAALVFDILAFGVISFIVNSVYGVEQVTSFSSSATGTFSTSTTSTQVNWLFLTLVWLAYVIGFEAVLGATPGKLLARLRVVRVDGTPLSVRAVVVRNLLKVIDGLPLLFLVGGVCVLLTRNSQRLGDMAAGTTVVYRHHALGQGETRNARPVDRMKLFAVIAAAIAFTALFNYFGRPPL